MNELAKSLYCVELRNGIQLWLEEEKADKIRHILLTTENKFIQYEEQTINVADIVGVFRASTMEEATRRKNGQWKDKKGNWQEKGARPCPKCGTILPFGKTCGRCGRF